MANIQHIKDSVHENVSNNRPINLTFLHGAYKLWRLKESPEADFAELFALMYYTKYVKPICEIHKPGVWFDFFVDDWILEIIDNYTPAEVSRYLNSYREVMKFLKKYQPDNLNMTITPISSCFDSRKQFDQKLEAKLAEMPAVKLSEKEKEMIELNVRVRDGQDDDPLWREKVHASELAYLTMKGETGYHKNRLDKILAFTQPLPSGTCISLGTTRSSIAKFWVGVGALKPAKDGYQMIILSPKQLKEASFDWASVNLGLGGKNFEKIRVLKSK